MRSLPRKKRSVDSLTPRAESQPSRAPCPPAASAPRAAMLERLPPDVQQKMIGYLAHRDISSFEKTSRTCRSAAQQFWEAKSAGTLPCHLPPGPGAVRRSCMQLADVLEGFAEDAADDPAALVGSLDGKNLRGRVAKYGLLARANETAWAHPEHLKLILDMCERAGRQNETAAWLGRLLTNMPAALPDVWRAVVEHGAPHAWVETCLPFKPHDLAATYALAKLDRAQLLLETVPPGVDLTDLCFEIVKAGALQTIQALLRRDATLSYRIASCVDAACLVGEQRVVGCRDAIFDLILEAGGGDTGVWSTLLATPQTPKHALAAMRAKSVDFNRVDLMGDTCILASRDAEVVAYLLQNGANPCVRNVRGHTVLHRLACSASGAKLIDDLVLLWGLDVNAPDQQACTPLHVVDIAPSFAVAAIARGARLMQRDASGVTAFKQMSQQEDAGPLCAVAALAYVAYGGDPEEVFSRVRFEPGAHLGATALDLMHKPPYAMTLALMDQSLTFHHTQMRSCLLLELASRLGCTFARPNHCGQTLAHFIAACGSVQHLGHLLCAGTPIDRRDFNGLTPLTLAAIRGHTDMCLALLEHGADPKLAGQAMLVPAQRGPKHSAYPFLFPKRPDALLDNEFGRSEYERFRATLKKAQQPHAKPIGGGFAQKAVRAPRALPQILRDIIAEYLRQKPPHTVLQIHSTGHD